MLSVEENQEHLERGARLDRVFILKSSAQDFDPQAIVTAYKQLLWVERALRTLKSFLRVRPVYHFTERCIRAHIFLCVLGLPDGEPSVPAVAPGRRSLQRSGGAQGA